MFRRLFIYWAITETGERTVTEKVFCRGTRQRQKREGGWRGKKYPRLELKQFIFVWRAGSPPPGWGLRWKHTLLWHTVCFCIHTGEEPGPQMACSQLCQPQTDLWTFYLCNSLVSLSLFLCNWQFAGFAVIRLLVIHNIKKIKQKQKPKTPKSPKQTTKNPKRLVSPQSSPSHPHNYNPLTCRFYFFFPGFILDASMCIFQLSIFSASTSLKD